MCQSKVHVEVGEQNITESDDNNSETGNCQCKADTISMIQLY